MHGSSLHYHACRHVAAACRSDLPMPVLGEPSTEDLVCIDCMNLSDVRELLQGFTLQDGDVERFWECFEQLRSRIGLAQLCTDCLYEKTGIDRRRHSNPPANQAE
jgi:hypothetical protein